MTLRRIIFILVSIFSSAILFAGNTCQLNIKQGDRGSISVEVTHGEKKTVIINKDPGYVIDKVEYNGKDVTADVNDKGEYTTPAINSDSALIISFKRKN